MAAIETEFRERSFSARDGLRLYFRDYGDPLSPGTPLLCLGGLTRNSKDFHRLGPAPLGAAPRALSRLSRPRAFALRPGLAPLRAATNLERRASTARRYQPAPGRGLRRFLWRLPGHGHGGGGADRARRSHPGRRRAGGRSGGRAPNSGLRLGRPPAARLGHRGRRVPRPGTRTCFGATTRPGGAVPKAATARARTAVSTSTGTRRSRGRSCSPDRARPTIGRSTARYARCPCWRSAAISRRC